ncbi:MAG: AAA family ATPase, partial [Spirochaetales bacterium]|nr:AAA family ATPase [Spirochaetales bacterium]
SIALCYMTGILPIKKYNTELALNNFKEFTMLKPFFVAPYIGFTEEEVKPLCQKFDMPFSDIKSRYEGYEFKGVGSIYSPFSVVNALTDHEINNYWIDTSSPNDLKQYININVDGLKEDVINMSLGKRVPVRVGSFANDFVSLYNKGQVMTHSIHLGYLAYDAENKDAYVPNNEVKENLLNLLKIVIGI